MNDLHEVLDIEIGDTILDVYGVTGKVIRINEDYTIVIKANDNGKLKKLRYQHIGVITKHEQTNKI